MAFVVSLSLCMAALSCCAFANLSSEYAHHAVLHPEEKMKLFWTIDWDHESVSFAVEAETTGWVGLGFSSNGQMIGSDMVIGWVKDGTGFLTDRFADAEAIPPIDKQQDYELTGSEESGGKTVLKFKRKIDTCDPRDYKLEEGATRVVFAYHTDDPVSATEMKYHVFRGTKTILLLNNMDRRNIDESGWQQMIATTLNVTIPPKETTYWCSLIKAPVLNKKHHIVMFEPYIQKGNERFVHHLILYECNGNFTEKDYGQGFDCKDAANMPFAKCRGPTLVAAWAVGGEAFYFPPHAGFPLEADDPSKNFLLEIHYNNAESLTNHTDSSGLRIYYTNKTRQYDSGIVGVGVKIDRRHIIPPKQESWISVGYCMHQCTESLYKSTNLSEGGINVFAAGLHTHLAGRAAWTKHVRNGKELPEIARDNHYDFNFQDIQVLRREVNIQPGDDLIHYCKYNTMDREKLIKGGISTKDEMCLDFLFYYPRIPGFKDCASTSYEPTHRFIDKYFNGEIDMTSLKNNQLVTININWNLSMASDFKKFEKEVDTVIPSCKVKDIKTIAELKNPNLTVPIPRITEPLPPKKSNCPEATKPAPQGPENHGSCLTSHLILVLLISTLCVVFVFSGFP